MEKTGIRGECSLTGGWLVWPVFLIPLWLFSQSARCSEAPTITSQPTNQTVWEGGTATFRVRATGAAPLSYNWYHNGIRVPPGPFEYWSSSNLVVQNIQSWHAGEYTVQVVNSFGIATSAAAVLTVIPVGTLAEALNATNLVWTTGGDFSPWYPQARMTHDDVGAAQSNLGGMGGESWLETTVDGPGVVTFFWSSSGEINSCMTLFMNGVPKALICGSWYGAWKQESRVVPYGRQTLRWAYRDVWRYSAGWLDEVTFTPTEPVPPTISDQPDSQEVTAGDDVTFTVAAEGTEPMSFQWRFNGDDIIGQSNTTLRLLNVQSGQAGDYTVFVSNPLGSVTSVVAHLSVIPTLPVITYQPQSQYAQEGEDVTFFVNAKGSEPITYQWWFEDEALADATNAALTLISVGSSHEGQYYVKVSNSLGTATSSSAELNVLTFAEALDAPDFVWTTYGDARWLAYSEATHDGVDAAQAGALIWADGVSSLSTVVLGPGIARFWWKVYAPISGYGIKFYIGSNLQVDRRGDVDWEQRVYYVPPGQQTLVWSFYVDDNGPYEGQTASLDEFSFTPGESAPVFWQQPGSTNAAAWTTVRLSAQAAGTPALKYQWQLEGADLAGATNPVLELKYVQATNGGTYRCIVSNAHGAVTSSNAVVSIWPSEVVAWGSNKYYDGQHSGQSDVPVGLSNIVAISAGGFHNLALREDNAVVAWGDNQYGESSVPEAARTNVAAIAAGGFHSLALRSDGTVLAWGANWDNQTMIGLGVVNALAIGAGIRHSLVVTEDGTVLSQGMNSEGQRVSLTGLGNVIAVTGGLALRADGTVVGLGSDSPAPVPGGLSNVVAIAAGDIFSVALKNDGNLVKWGGRPDIPTAVSNVVAIAAGGGHMLALKSGGTIASWGANYYGQSDIPPGLQNVSAISAGLDHSLALAGTAVSAFTAHPIDFARTGGVSRLSIQTVRGTRYFLESTDSLHASRWRFLYGIAGDGTVRTFVDSAAISPQRFYRVRLFR
jgi:hypothetical protein